MTISISKKGFVSATDLPEHGKMDSIAACIMAADRVVSQLPFGTTTFSTEDVYPVVSEIIGMSENDCRKKIDPIILKSIISGHFADDDYDVVIEDRKKSEYILTVRADAKTIRIAPEGSEKQYIVPTRGVSIPWQLKDAKFIVLLPKSKLPYGSSTRENPIWYHDNSYQRIKISWMESRYQYNWDEMSIILSRQYSDYNYAVIDKSYVVIDCDDYDGIRENCPDIDNLIESTFTVKSGRNTSVGYHIYLQCNDIPEKYFGKKLALTDPYTRKDLGDLRIHGNYLTLGPNSTHPISGNKYVVQTDLPIRTVSWNELHDILNSVVKIKIRKEKVIELEKPLASNVNIGNQSGVVKTPASQSRGKYTGRDYIGEWNKRHSLEQMLVNFGYTPCENGMYARPDSVSKNPDTKVNLWNGVESFYAYASGDFFCDGHQHTAFDLMKHFVFADDFNSAKDCVIYELRDA